MHKYDLDPRGQPSWSHSAITDVTVFFALKGIEECSVQSVEPAAFLPCIRAADISRPPVPITPSLNFQ